MSDNTLPLSVIQQRATPGKHYRDADGFIKAGEGADVIVADFDCEPLDIDEREANKALHLHWAEVGPILQRALQDLHSCHRAFSSNENWTSCDDDAREQAEKALEATERVRV